MPTVDLVSSTSILLSLLTAAVFVLAGTVKGVVGLGLPTIAMALLALLMPPAEAAALLVVPSLATNVWQLQPWRTLGPMLRRLAQMQSGTCLGTLAGAWALGAPVGAWAMVSLGAALVAYAAWGLSGARLVVGSQAERRLGFPVGVATGFVTAATGVFVVPAVPYLQALGFEREELLQAMGISFTVSTVALAAGLYLNARYSGAALSLSFVMLLPAWGGMQLGQWLRQKLSPVVFRRCFLASLALLGVHMMARELLLG
ncbi:sulfite exporter TauE/SafE family protein [Myxococcus sp. Y35]|uniref:sulfite exporter TauE/SafE family protein n=1 Tax=Pseudomyxococcus flavus TaxID=3115648 RepID=UPI003CE99F98